MAANIVTVYLMLLTYLLLTYEAMPETINVNKNSERLADANLTCINLLPDGSLAPAAKCTNGRRLPGCCIDRVYCDYSTLSIDLTLYGPRGYKSSCKSTYVCCPLRYVLPFVPSTDDSKDYEDASDEDMMDILKNFD